MIRYTMPYSTRSGYLRRDQSADAHRFLDCDHLAAGISGGDRVTICPRRLLAEPFQKARRIRDLGSGLLRRLAVLQAQYIAQIILVSHHQVMPFAKQPRTLPARRGAECAKGIRGCADGQVDIVLGAVRAAADKLAIGWVY